MEDILCDLFTFPVHRSQRPAAQLGTCGSTGLCAIGPDCTIRNLNVRVGEAAVGSTCEALGEDLELSSPCCIPQHFKVSRDGRNALIGGATTDDTDRSAVCLIDLSTSGQPETQLLVDAALYKTRPGLEVVQIDWHPNSAAHFAVLTSDATWRLYSTEDLTRPEQQIKLQFQPSRKVGLTQDVGSQSPCMAFCFGADHAWERFTVFFTCTDGATYCLCPVAPFGSTCPAASLPHMRQLVASSSAKDAAYTKEWLQQAFPDNPGSKSRLVVHAHALEAHAPALMGPVASFAPEADAGGTSSAPFSTVMTLRYADKASALLVSTSAGLIRAYLLADDILPCWCESPPQHCVEDGSTSAVRLQAKRVSDRAQSLLLLDVLDLRDHEAASSAHPAGRTESESLQLLRDPAAGERVFVSLPHAVFSIRLSWLPALAHAFLKGTQQGLQELPAPALEELWRATGSRKVVSAAVVGDVLSGVKLALWDSQGRLQLLQPFCGASAHPHQGLHARSQELSSGSAAEVDAELERRYGSILQGPRPLDLPPLATPTAAGEAAGAALLSDCTSVLRAKHVEFLHSAHQTLLHRAEAAAEEGGRQEEWSAEVAEEAAGLQGRMEGLQGRLKAAWQLHANLTARAGLLVDLHRSLPYPLTPAEATLKSHGLPALEWRCQSLQADITGLKSATAKSSHSRAVRVKTSTPVLQYEQLRKAQQSLSAQAAVLAEAMHRTKILEGALQAHAALVS
ncbi:hypothetical protein WJX84_011045 [Apatococcus fuscideae]|uniref:Cilia- and flagella-associated protein 43 n=1 Tax=Apatococcus fuscideae TaxID=2026836 RepID=A0AAW1TH31_9CHLO